MRNPYLDVHARAAARRPTAGLPALWVKLVAAALAAPLARPVLLAFLDAGSVPDGVEAIGFRLGALMVAVMSITTYSALVRGPDRPVLDPHPVQPRLLLEALVVQTARAQVGLPLMAILLLSPLAQAGYMLAFLGASALVLGRGSAGWAWALPDPSAACGRLTARGSRPCSTRCVA